MNQALLTFIKDFYLQVQSARRAGEEEHVYLFQDLEVTVKIRNL